MKKYLAKVFLMAAVITLISSSCEHKNSYKGERKRYFDVNPTSNAALVDQYIENLASGDNNDYSYSFSK